jgi:hypothetical protein
MNEQELLDTAKAFFADDKIHWRRNEHMPDNQLPATHVTCTIAKKGEILL